MNAVLWITGDRLCSTGQPITPTSRLAPSTRVRTRSSAKAGGHVVLERREVLRELVVPVGAAQHVVEVVTGRGVQGRLERRRSRARDRRGGQAGVDPRVVRRSTLQIRFGQGVVAGRGVVVQE